MKILLICEDLPAAKNGGLAKHVVLLGNSLIAQGHDVSLLGLRDVNYEEVAQEVGFNGGFIPGLTSPLGGWKERSLGFFNPLKRPYFSWRLANEIARHAKNFDVVHYHGHLPMVGFFIPRSINFIQTRHDQGGDCMTNVRFKDNEICNERNPLSCAKCIRQSNNPSPIRDYISSLAVRWSRSLTLKSYEKHYVIFVSDFLRENFLKIYPPTMLPNSFVIHNFVDDNLLKMTEMDISRTASQNAVTQNLRIHIAARLDMPKGVLQFLDEILPRLPNNMKIDIYGDGPLRSVIEVAYKHPSVMLHGHKPYSEIVQATNSADVVVVPSIWEEPCGTTILEALKLGKQCFALNRGGTPELIKYAEKDQLQLFPDISSLVAGLIQLNTFPVFHNDKSCDVMSALPNIIRSYRTCMKLQDGS